MAWRLGSGRNVSRAPGMRRWTDAAIASAVGLIAAMLYIECVSLSRGASDSSTSARSASGMYISGIVVSARQKASYAPFLSPSKYM